MNLLSSRLNKKRNKRMGVILMMTSMTLFFSGCEKTEEPEIQEVVESIVVEFNDAIPNVLKMSREEINALSLEDFKASIKQYLPKYKEYFRVPADYVVTDKDWENFRYLLCESLFGPESEEGDLEVTAPELFAQQFGGIDTENDPDWIYKAPTKKLLEDMSISEFKDYYIGMYVFLEKNNYEDSKEFEEKKESFVEAVNGLSEEELNKIRWNFIDSLEF